MKVILITIGSAGDVHPFIGLGVELKRRGHHVVLLTSDYFERGIRDAGLEFAAMSSAEEFKDILSHPDLWHPVRGMQLLYKHVFGKLIPVVYEFVAKNYVVGETVVVASTLSFGARIAQEKLHVPTVSVHLQPSVFRSVYDTPVYPGLGFLTACPVWLKRLLFRLMDGYIDRLIMPELNAFRKIQGLAPVSRLFDTWFNSPDLVIGLFPDWFAPPQSDWPPQARLTGFPLFDGGRERPLTPEVSRFLASGEPPIVFTAGSAMKQGQWFFEAAVDACRRLKCRGLLINAFREQVPEILPEEVLFTDYAPFSQVFSRARVVVHAGGIGTTAQVLAAGVPQLIVPLAFDQPDQAARIERMGAGLQIDRPRFRGPEVAAALQKILDTPELQERAREFAARIQGQHAVAATCDLIEGSFRRSVLRP